MGRYSDQMLVEKPDYPRNEAGWKEPTTSRAAIPSKHTAETLRAQMLQAIKDSIFGLTADEAGEQIGVSPFTSRPRASELNAMGLIRDSRARRKNPSSGKSVKVWIAT